MPILVAVMALFSVMAHCATEEIQMNDSTVVVGIKSSNVSNNEVGVLKPWRKYYQEHISISALEIGEREMVDCLERATKKTVLIRPANVVGKFYKNGTWTTNSLQESVYLNETDVAVRLLYAQEGKDTGVDFVWDLGKVNGELVMLRSSLMTNGDLFTSKIALGIATVATVAVVMTAFAIYLSVTSGKPMLALFQGISLITQGVNESDFVHTKAFSSGRMILMMGALSSLVCMSIYTAGLASRIASVKHKEPTIMGLHGSGYTWVMSQYQNQSIVLEKPDFLIESLQQKNSSYKKILENSIVVQGLYKAIVEVLYSNKTTFLVHKSGALRRTEEYFARSELGKLSYVELATYRRASLPMSRIQSRRKIVVDALLKIRETGLLKFVSNLWLGTKRHDQTRDSPNFLPAGIIQTKSVFVTLVLGQFLAIVIGLAECIVGRYKKRDSAININISPGVCLTCGK